jgi:hypothetical protein
MDKVRPENQSEYTPVIARPEKLAGPPVKSPDDSGFPNGPALRAFLSR